jgi:O-antigen/teichoic acid export membrane protein
VEASQVARGTLGSLAAHVLIKARGLVVVPLYAWLLAPAELGVVNVAVAVASLLSPLLYFGLPTGLVLTLHHAEAERARRMLRSALVLVGSCVAGLVVLLPAVLVAAQSALAPHALVVALLAGGMALRETGQAVPQLMRQTGFLLGLTFLVEYGGTALGLGAVALGYGPGGLLWASALTALACGALAIRRATSIMPGGSWDRQALGEPLRVGFPLLLIVVAQIVVQNADRLILVRSLGPAAVGAYALGSVVASAVLALAATVNLVFAPVAVSLRGDTDRLARWVGTGLRLLSFLGGLCVAGAFLVGAPALERLAGADYSAAADVLPWMTLAYGLFTLVQLLQWVPLSVSRDVGGVVRLASASAVADVVLCFVLVPRLGALGAAIAVVAAHGLGLVLTAPLVTRALPSFSLAPLAGPTVLGALACAIGARYALPREAALAEVALHGTALVAAYAALGWVLGCWRRSDLNLLRGAR